MTITSVGTPVSTAVTTGQSTVSLTTVNESDLVIAFFTVYGNIQITGVAGGGCNWEEAAGPLFNSTIGATTHLWLGTVETVGSAAIALTFSTAIGSTKVQNTIEQISSPTGAGTEWNFGVDSRTNVASTTLTYPPLAATYGTVDYTPYGATGGTFAYFGYAVSTPTGSAGSTAGFSYIVDSSTDVVAYDLAVTGTVAPTAVTATSAVSISLGVMLMPYLPGSAFLITQPLAEGLAVAVEIAWSANLSDLTGLSYPWTDVTKDVLIEDGRHIAITLGSPNDAPNSQTQTCVMNCTLLNGRAQYSLGGQSENWPNVIRNVPVRVRVLADGQWHLKFQAGAVSFQPRWDDVGKFATVELVSSGILRRLDQGTLPAASVYRQRIPVDTVAYPGLVMYWPCEGSNGVSAVLPVVPNPATLSTPILTNMTLIPNINYFPVALANPSTNAFPLSAPLPGQGDLVTQHFAAAGSLAVPGNLTTTGTWQFRFMCGIGSLPSGQTQPLLIWQTSASSTAQWVLDLNSTGGLGLSYNGATPVMPTFNMNGSARLIQVQVVQSGANVNYQISTLDQGGTPAYFAGTINSATLGTITGINWIGPNINTSSAPIIEGHLTVQNVANDIINTETMFLGLTGETLKARLIRLCTLAGIPLTILDSTATETSTNPADVMGAQYYDTITNLLRECETTGQGVLYDGLGPGLTYVTRQLRESQQPTVVLDASVGHLVTSFEPIDDDQNVINDATVARRNGGSYTAQVTGGPQGIGQIGDYATSATVNQVGDAALAYTAQWLINLGTPTGYRYPTLQFALEFSPDLIPGWLKMIPSGRLDVINITDVRAQMLNATIKNCVQGWTEEISLTSWRVHANCSSYDPWRVITLAHDTGSTDDTTCWLDTDGSTLATGATAGASTISVATTSPGSPLWVQGSGDDFPFTVQVGGTPLEVASISNGSSPQTFVLTSPTPYAIPAGVPVSIFDPPVLGM